ncbi:MAG: Jag N-terminal domain-containing protein [Candidatus Syntrophosphaera sp.]|nr:Jag N-terminal domain-containing protein [Candidatus Syntrophosphaera sp.]
MTSIDKNGTSIEKIISAFRREHRIKDWELKYDIIKKPSAGFLGLFANKTAVVRFQLPDLGERAASFLDMLLKKMGVPFDGVSAKTQGKTIYLEVKGSKDSGFLIGKNGSMLETLQYLVNRVYENDKNLDRIYIDAEGYRERREATFLRQFMPLIKKVKEQGKPQTLEPMNAADRRVIHRHIERDRGLRTLTIGEGEKKRIVIFSAKQSESEVLSQTRQARPRPRPHKKTGEPKN